MPGGCRAFMEPQERSTAKAPDLPARFWERPSESGPRRFCAGRGRDPPPDLRMGTDGGRSL
jgi:hypothetical protein